MLRMWSLTRMLGHSIVQNLNLAKSSTLPATFSNIRNFSLLTSRTTTALTSPRIGVPAVRTEGHSLLQAVPTPLLQLANGFKVKGRLKRRCKDCYIVVRQERHYVMCKSHGRHKQMSMQKSEKNSWILTDATQSKVRAW